MARCLYCESLIKNPNDKFCCQSCQLIYEWVEHRLNPINLSNKGKFEHYNSLDLEKQFNKSLDVNVKSFKIHVEGLQCSSCVHLIEDLTVFDSRILRSKINFAKGLLEIETSSNINLGEILEIIHSFGYNPTALKEDSDYEKAAKAESREELKRIGVAGAIAANEMLFSIPIYAGLSHELAKVFNYIGFIIFLPLLFYSASTFYKRAWSNLLMRRLSVDTMIVVALWGGFILSSYSLFTGHDDIYFDSTASFIFLILATRYLLRSQHQRVFKSDLFVDMFKDEVYEMIADTKSIKNIAEVKIGDQFKIKKDQFLGFDAVLLSETAKLDHSFITGESRTQIAHKGDLIRAGTKILSDFTLVECQEAPAQTEMSKAIKKIEMLVHDKSKYQSLTDLVSQRLTLVVFGVAIGYFLLMFESLGYEAFKRSLALITIACPCAVAFGTPLAHHLGIRKALAQGFFIRTESVFDKINKIRRIIFDKTGTLTSSELKLVKTFPNNISEEAKKVILGLEKNSVHPVANTLKREWSEIDPYHIADAVEIVGHGVGGSLGGTTYSIQKSKGNNDLIQVDFYRNGTAEAYLFFEESIIPEAKSVVDYFYENDFEVCLLSGDRRGRVVEVAKRLGIRPSHAYSEQSQVSKATIISQNNPCLFVGDGINDLAGLKTAELSFAVRGPFEATMKVSDVFAPQKDLKSLVSLFRISKDVERTVQFNLIFALFYNAIGASLALMGLINPLMAAILMPISSLIITLHTAWRLK